MVMFDKLGKNVQRPLELKVGPGGRVVIPARVRRELGVEIGDLLVARLDGEHLVLRTRMAGIRRVQAIARKYSPDIGGDTRYVDAFIAERKAEARQEREHG